MKRIYKADWEQRSSSLFDKDMTNKGLNSLNSFLYYYGRKRLL